MDESSSFNFYNPKSRAMVDNQKKWAQGSEEAPDGNSTLSMGFASLERRTASNVTNLLGQCVLVSAVEEGALTQAAVTPSHEPSCDDEDKITVEPVPQPPSKQLSNTYQNSPNSALSNVDNELSKLTSSGVRFADDDEILEKNCPQNASKRRASIIHRATNIMSNILGRSSTATTINVESSGDLGALENVSKDVLDSEGTLEKSKRRFSFFKQQKSTADLKQEKSQIKGQDMRPRRMSLFQRIKSAMRLGGRSEGAVAA